MQYDSQHTISQLGRSVLLLEDQTLSFSQQRTARQNRHVVAVYSVQR